MKQRLTQRLFWKRWPYKILLMFSEKDQQTRDRVPRKFSRWTETLGDDIRLKIQFRQWFKKHHPEGGIRSESGISVFLDTQDEVDSVIDAWKKYVIEVWQPATDESLALMKDHVYDVVRPSLWYRRFHMRARILYTQEFYVNGLPTLQSALGGFEKDSWQARGLLMDLIANTKGRLPWAWGQPMYLYLSDNEDAIMLKLQVGDWIERFERIRQP